MFFNDYHSSTPAAAQATTLYSYTPGTYASLGSGVHRPSATRTHLDVLTGDAALDGDPCYHLVSLELTTPGVSMELIRSSSALAIFLPPEDDGSTRCT